ncbi:hypothetical protein EDL79_02405 [Ehrlichia ruminantium]|uniref:Uncharacterized protein n=1 Tax=Ehrlichia ruminantium TaxID=779 RepID=A0AAE6QAS6_EHRRU|nr:hypothetical protein [Ehrlichia ruminantium]QGR02494.1 hypothetical protein EDL81_02365 [Ehrlichia ruminantium]QGR03423.1 hypothetical protein EDL80_02410 [Ehrlichia ruminantium]QGR04343.1 hypothetical protein EDL79_02405 [Ehrlichia ruminantium]
MLDVIISDIKSFDLNFVVYPIINVSSQYYILQQRENVIYENLKLSSEMLYSEIQERQNVENISVIKYC